MQKKSKFFRFLLLSPYFPLLFLLLPGILILGRLFHLRLPVDVPLNLLLANNICLLGALGTRLWHYGAGLRREIRYGGELPRRAPALEPGCSGLRVREVLAAAGFHFLGEGMYGEKHNPGYLGTALIYGGLFFLLLIGTWDNLRQFSGTLIKGPGIALDLSKADKYYHLITGPLASPAGFPSLKVTKQVFPDSTYPYGASEIKLYSRNGKYLDGAFIDAAKGPYRYGGYDIYVARLLADIALTIKTKGSEENNVFDDAVKLWPLYDKKVGDFSLRGEFATPAGDDGDVLYDPVHDVFKITLTHKGKAVVSTDYTFQAYREKEEGNFVVSVQGMGHWTEIHIVRRRHMPLMLIGAVVAALGVLLRIFFRPQRVWLEEGEQGCRIRYVGKNPMRDEG